MLRIIEELIDLLLSLRDKGWCTRFPSWRILSLLNNWILDGLCASEANLSTSTLMRSRSDRWFASHQLKIMVIRCLFTALPALVISGMKRVIHFLFNSLSERRHLEHMPVCCRHYRLTKTLNLTENVVLRPNHSEKWTRRTSKVLSDFSVQALDDIFWISSTHATLVGSNVESDGKKGSRNIDRDESPRLTIGDEACRWFLSSKRCEENGAGWLTTCRFGLERSRWIRSSCRGSWWYEFPVEVRRWM